MISRHKIISYNDDRILILFLDLNSEFGGFGNKKKSLKTEINKYIKNNKIKFNNKIFIAVGGIVLASLLYINNDIVLNKIENGKILKYTDNNLITIITRKVEQKPSINISSLNDDKKTNLTIENSKKNNVQTKKEDIVTKPKEKQNIIKSNDSNQENKQYVSIYRKNNNVVKLELEEYIIGVIAAEMPASFHIEALKSQAVVARTYALKSIKTNKKLTDTVSTQAYIDNEQMKNKWGSEYNKYYNKIKNAVKETKGMYIVYNGEIIDTDFDIDITDNKLLITTRGYGHGVGLSQYGSNGMAKEGYKYDKIIKHYYTGVDIVKLN